MTDFLIIGAGINGLLLARELLAAGASVRLLERGEAGREASWAGGGIVSPLYPWRYDSAVTALADWAQAFYPRLAAELQDQTGLDVELNSCGLLMLDADDEVTALDWAAKRDRSMARLGSEQIYEREPALSAGFESGLWMQDIANVRNPRLLHALLVGLQQSDRFHLHQHMEVMQLHQSGSRIREVEVRTAAPAHSSSFKAEEVVVTAGAWSSKLLAAAGEVIPIEPVKGQMLLYQFDQTPVQSIVLHEGRYLIPRLDGHVLVGSTLEHVGFDKTVTAEAHNSLAASAQRILPALKGMAPVKQWAGLRPGSPQGLPSIGRLQSIENLSVSAGHYRNGLVLAPASARLLADILLQRPTIVDPAPYVPIQRG